MRARLDAFHRWLARRPLAVRLAVKLRNQANAVIGAHLGESIDHERNGEALLVRTVAPYVATFVDVGAHTGGWVRLLLEAGRSDVMGVCFEPNEALHPQLRQAVGSAQVAVSGRAVSDRDGDSWFHLDPSSDQLSRIVANGRHAAGVVRVTTTTLDHEFERLGLLDIGLVKIDAEGHDLHVLRGLAGALARRAVGVVQFEYGDRWPGAGSTLAAALDLLESNGYTCYRLSSTGLRAVAYDTYGEHFRYSNYVAASPQAQAWIHAIIEGGQRGASEAHASAAGDGTSGRTMA